MTYEEGYNAWHMPLVVLVELKKHGVQCRVDWQNKCIWVRDEYTQDGRDWEEWTHWDFSPHGKIHGSRVFRFLGY